MLASYDRAYAERDKTESGSYVQEYVNHFLQGEPTPGIEYEQKLVQALVPTITAAEVDRGCQGDVRRHEPRDSGGLAAEGRRDGADRCAARRPRFRRPMRSR